jgi:uncharacterized protein (DUF305 family)
MCVLMPEFISSRPFNMRRVPGFRIFTAALACALVVPFMTGCGGTAASVAPDETEEFAPEPRVVQPGAPGQPSRSVDAAAVLDRTSMEFTSAEVRFMQDMMHHHAQAVEMGALVAERTGNDDIRLLARRIEVSQDDEMALMRAWLEDRGQTVPDIRPTIDPHAGHGHHDHHAHQGHSMDAHADHDEMPGMLTPDQMQQLADARGEEFDRLFLEFMIMHHEGALIMVEQLFQTEGAGQQSDTFSFASHVDSDQRIEILRMRRMLEALNQPVDN